MNKSILYIIAIVCFITTQSCSDDNLKTIMGSLVDAPEATIERDVKGHEQIRSIQAILRIARQNADGTYTAYDIDAETPPIPIYQEITFKKDDSGNVTITSRRKQFDVIISPKFKYALELKYYDINGQFINHQFGGYDEKDKENSTLLVHQHFFSLQTYAINGQPLTFPMTLDSIYYDKYLFDTNNNGERLPGAISTLTNVYAPQEYKPNSLKYNLKLALRANELAMSKKVLEPYKDPATGIINRLYKTIGAEKLNQLAPEIFNYEYRDTDPIESQLGSVLSEYDDLGRLRVGQRVGRLRKERSLSPGKPLDALGFKGILTLNHPNMAFQMRVCICHILTPGGKYDISEAEGGLHKFNQISPAWNSYDIDYPIPFRVIADTYNGMQQCLKDINRFYPVKGKESWIKKY